MPVTPVAPAPLIGVFGAGGFGREVLWLVEQAWGDVPAVFVDGNPQVVGTTLHDRPVWSLERAIEARGEIALIVAVGKPQTREKIVGLAAAAGLRFATIVHPRVESSRWVTWGEGAVVCAGNVITVDVAIGAHAHVNLDCTIGHDVIIGDFTTLSPGVHVSGWVHFGRRVFVGTGAVFVNGTADKPLVIGDDAVIGAGAVVNRDVAAGTTVVGVPARPR